MLTCHPPFALAPRLAFPEMNPLAVLHALSSSVCEVAPVTLHFDDQFPSFREVDGLSDTAFRLHVTAFFWIRTNRTDGLIRTEDLALVCARVRASERFAAECVRRGAWHDARHDCGSEHCLGPVDVDGYVVHDYLKENPSRVELEAEEAGKSRGGKRGNHRRWHVAKGKTAPGCEFCEEEAEAPAAPANPPQKRTSHKRSHTDRISDSGATPIDRSDLDQDLSLVSKSKSSRSKSARARGPAPGSQEFRRQVMAKFAEVAKVEIGPDVADVIAVDVLGAREGVDNPLLYVQRAIENEADPPGRWLPDYARPAKAAPADLDWCGHCDEIYRTLENEQGKVYPCPVCSAKSFAAWEATAS